MRLEDKPKNDDSGVSEINSAEVKTTAIVSAKGSKFWDILPVWLYDPLRYLFGRDAFVSYSRYDAGEYAPNLVLTVQKRARKKNRKISFYLDKWIAPPDGELPKSLKRQLRWSSMLVVICTKNSIRSPFVKDEIEHFARLKRKIILINVDNILSDNDSINTNESPWREISGALPTAEPEGIQAIEKKKPSSHVISRILTSIEFTRQDQRLLRSVWGTLAFILIFTGAAFAYNYFTIKDARKQAGEAIEQARIADENRIIAEEGVVEAQKKVEQANIDLKSAKDNEKAANDRTDVANDRAETAETKAATEEQRALKATALASAKTQIAEVAEIKASQAESRQKTAENNAISIEDASAAINQLPFNPEASVFLAGRAFQRAQTDLAESALRRSLFDSNIKTVMRGHKNRVLAARFDHSGDFVVTKEDYTARVWETSTGELIKSLDLENYYGEMSISKNSRFIIFADPFREKMLLWDWRAEKSKDNPRVLQGTREYCLKEEILRQCGISSLAFSSDNQYVAAGAGEGIVRVWNVEDGKIVNSMNLPEPETYENMVYAISFSANNEYILTGATNGKAILWRWDKKNESKRVLPHGKEDSVRIASFGGLNDEYILTVTEKYDLKNSVTESGQISIWNTFTQEDKPVKKLGDFTNGIWNVKMSPDGNLVALAPSNDTIAKVLNWKSNQITEPPIILRGHTQYISTINFSPNGEYIVTSSQDGTARIWKIDAGKTSGVAAGIPYTIPSIAILRGHTGGVNEAVFSKNGLFIVTAGDDTTARVWNSNIEDNTLVATLPKANTAGAAFNPVDNSLLVTVDSIFGPLRVQNWQNGKKIPAILFHPETSDRREINAPFFSRDGNYVAAICEYESVKSGQDAAEVAIWDWKSEANRNNPTILNIPGYKTNSANFSYNDGKYLVTTSFHGTDHEDTKNIYIWDWKTEAGRKKPLVKLVGHKDEVTSAVFSKNNRFIVSSGDDGTVRIWDWQSETKRQNPLVLNGGGINGISFYSVTISSDGRYIAAAAHQALYPSIALVWDLQSEERRQNPIQIGGYSNPVGTVEFSPDGKIILTGSSYGSVRLWDTGTGTQLSIVTAQNFLTGKASFSSDGKLILVPNEKEYKIYSCDRCAPANELKDLIPRYVSFQNPNLFTK